MEMGKGHYMKTKQQNGIANHISYYHRESNRAVSYSNYHFLQNHTSNYKSSIITLAENMKKTIISNVSQNAQVTKQYCFTRNKKQSYWTVYAKTMSITFHIKVPCYPISKRNSTSVE